MYCDDVCVLIWTNRKYVYVTVCLLCVVVWCSMKYDVVMSPLHILRRRYAGRYWSLFVVLGDGCRVGSALTARTFVLLARIQYVLLVSDAVWSRNLTLVCSSNNWRWWWTICIYLRPLNEWGNGVVLTPIIQHVCFVAVCVFDFELTIALPW